MDVDSVWWKGLLEVLIENQKDIANTHYKNGNYQKAISCYSRVLLNWDNNVKIYLRNNPGWNSSDPVIAERLNIQDQVREQRCILLNNRAECYRQLKRYHKALLDLNRIINASKGYEYGSKISWMKMMIPHCKKAILRAANIFESLGNTGQSLKLYLMVYAEPFFVKCSHQWVRLSAMRHPCSQSLIPSNKYTKKLNKFSINRWKQITPKNAHCLPFKHGHSMVVYQGKIYSFGGSIIEYGDEILHNDNCGDLFYKISIHHQNNNYFYTWDKLDFPKKFKYKIINSTDGKSYESWSKLVTINLWKNNIILFGGYNAFNNVLKFNLKTSKWNIFKVQSIGFDVPESISSHSAIIMNNKLFVYGGYDNNSEPIDALFCLDLIDKKWQKFGEKNNKIPTRFDHVMWSDLHKGTSGSIYVGFGSFDRDDIPMTPFCRRLIWRFDVARNEWNVVKTYGNAPVYRSESGYVSTKNGIIIFGGYNGGLPSSFGEIKNGKPEKVGQFVFFADCFEFNRRTEQWKMIQSKVYPGHRALSGVCKLKNMIVVYGGYHGGIKEQSKVFNDLWILDLKECETINIKLKKCEKCNVTSNETRLYICKRCVNARYCSKQCQKKHWRQHKLYCK